MMSKKEKEFKLALNRLRKDAPDAFSSIIIAGLIWLFGVLVFIPLVSSIDLTGRASLFCSLIVIVTVSLIIFRALPKLKGAIDAFSLLLAIKYGRTKGLSYEDSKVLFRYFSYIAVSLLLCVFYWPILTTIHPALFGLVLTLILIWIFFLLARIFSIILPKLLT